MPAQTDSPLRAVSERRFFGWMALAVVASVFLGFARSFFLRPLFPNWPAPPEPFFILHGVAFTAWVVLLYVQTTLIASGRADVHRKAGSFGVALAIAIVVLGILAALIGARRPGGFVGIPVPPLQFLAVPLFAMALFFFFVALAVARRRDAQSHKRLMLLASLQLVPAAVARWPVITPVIMTYGPPVFFGITDMFIVALAVWDLRTRGRLHPVTLWGGILAIAAQPAQLALSGTEAWLAFARWATGLLG